jgi:ubiquitin-protein ligase
VNLKKRIKLNNFSDHPLEPEIADLYKSDKNAFLKTAKEWTKKYAK